MGLVLDTSALVAVERAGASYSELLASLAEEEAVVPAIVVAELLAGVRLAGDTRRAARRQAKIDSLLAAAPVIDFGAEIAELWADCFAALERAGNRRQLVRGDSAGPLTCAAVPTGTSSPMRPSRGGSSSTICT